MFLDDGRRIYSVGEDAAVLSSVNMIRFDADSLRMTLSRPILSAAGHPVMSICRPMTDMRLQPTIMEGM